MSTGLSLKRSGHFCGKWLLPPNCGRIHLCQVARRRSSFLPPTTSPSCCRPRRRRTWWREKRKEVREKEMAYQSVGFPRRRRPSQRFMRQGQTPGFVGPNRQRRRWKRRPQPGRRREINSLIERRDRTVNRRERGGGAAAAGCFKSSLLRPSHPLSWVFGRFRRRRHRRRLVPFGFRPFPSFAAARTGEFTADITHSSWGPRRRRGRPRLGCPA
jgi:hypothetical protein